MLIVLASRDMCIRIIGLLFVLLFSSLHEIHARDFFIEKEVIKDVQKNRSADTHDHWINVFIHGTHGFLLGLLSIPDVLLDTIEDSLYKKMLHQWRNSNISYFNQVMSEEGLHQVLLSQENLKKITSMTIPIVRAFDQIAQLVQASYVKNDYYTFGWNGALSQKERRLEALSLYHALSTLVASFQQKNIIPKIRLLSHSHGGNLCLNLAALYESLPNHQELNMIDELIMFARPIQQETEVLCSSPFFKKIIHCYSDNDATQTADIISTGEHASRRKISCGSSTQVQQVRCMIGRYVNDCEIASSPDFSIKKFIDKISISSLFRGGLLISDYQDDPTHQDFWHIHWNKHKIFYDPLPLVVFTPLILKALQDIKLTDLDINISATNTHACFDLYRYNTYDHVKHLEYSLECINSVKSLFLSTKNLNKIFNFSFVLGG